jgi:hypothetical protein
LIPYFDRWNEIAEKYEAVEKYQLENGKNCFQLVHQLYLERVLVNHVLVFDHGKGHVCEHVNKMKIVEKYYDYKDDPNFESIEGVVCNKGGLCSIHAIKECVILLYDFFIFNILNIFLEDYVHVSNEENSEDILSHNHHLEIGRSFLIEHDM